MKEVSTVNQNTSVQSVISHVNSAKRDIESFPKSGLSKKSITELDLAYSSLNDTINHCNKALQDL